MSLSKKINFASILVYLYLAISVFLTCYTFYRAEIVHSGNQFSYYYKYYLIFIFGNFFWFIILFLNDKKKLQIVIIISSLCFVLYFGFKWKYIFCIFGKILYYVTSIQDC